MPSELDAAEVFRRAALWAKARANDLPTGDPSDVTKVEGAADLASFFDWITGVLTDDREDGYAIARAILNADRAERGDTASRILNLLDSDAELDRTQAYSLLIDSDSKELWDAVMAGLDVVAASTLAAPTGQLAGSFPTTWVQDAALAQVRPDAVILRHRDLRDSPLLRRLLHACPFHDYRSIKSLIVKAREHDSLEFLARLEALEEVVLDLRRDPLRETWGANQVGDHPPPPTISLRGLDVLPLVTKLTLIVDHDTTPVVCSVCDGTEWSFTLGNRDDARDWGDLIATCEECKKRGRFPFLASSTLPRGGAHATSVTRVLGFPWRGIAEVRDVHAPHWKYGANGWEFAKDWTQHLGRIETLRVLPASPKPADSAGDSAAAAGKPAKRAKGKAKAREGLPDVFPYALTAFMPALRAVTIDAELTFVGAGSQPALPGLRPDQIERLRSAGRPDEAKEDPDDASDPTVGMVEDDTPWAHATGHDDHGAWALTTIAGVEVKFRLCPPGRFRMGSPEDEEGREFDEHQRDVELTRGVWLLESPVTQRLWQAVMGENPSCEPEEERPVETISWFDCQLFLKRARLKHPGLNVRLPTEAEWEYACRAGTTAPTWLGENTAANLDGIAWFGPDEDPDTFDSVEGTGNSDFKTRPVKQKASNPWGLFDMLGNVSEWCADWYIADPSGGVDPAGPTEEEVQKRWDDEAAEKRRQIEEFRKAGDVNSVRYLEALGRFSNDLQRVMRGSSSANPASEMRAARREFDQPDSHGPFQGFRLARTPASHDGRSSTPSNASAEKRQRKKRAAVATAAPATSTTDAPASSGEARTTTRSRKSSSKSKRGSTSMQ